MPTVLKSGNLNLLEPSGPVQACNGIALPLPLVVTLGTAACPAPNFSRVVEGGSNYKELRVPLGLAPGPGFASKRCVTILPSVCSLSCQHFSFPCQYHPTNAPHSSSSTRCSYQKDKRAKPGNLPKSNAVSQIDVQRVEIHCV